MKKKILIIAAHPDDEILGCGGTIAKLASEGSEVYTIILGEGVTARDEKRKGKKREKDVKCLKEDAYKANAIIGVKDIFVYDFPDNRFDTVAFLDIVKVIEKVKEKIKPDIIYTHYSNDLNIDHRITYNAVLTASRPIKGNTVKEIYSFEVPSSSEWNYPCVFNPNTFVDITGTIEKKAKGMKCYKTELRKFPHPRSSESIANTAKRWGSIAGLSYAEAFEAIRIIK